MNDLNDLRYFALIVENGGFSAAERKARITKSKLSRRVALLEDRLGVKLLRRSTRRLALTEAGQAFYQHCAAIVVEAEAAQTAVEQLRSEPAGTIRVTCPASMAQIYIARLLAEFMRQYPKVRVELDTTDRIVNILEERIDVAVRIAQPGLLDPGLVARRVATGRAILVASPAYLESRPPIEDPSLLSGLDTIGTLRDGAEQTWSLVSSSTAEARKILVRPRLLCSEIVVQHEAAIGGVGIALLPLRVVWRALQSEALQRIAKDWGTPELPIHLVYPSRRETLPSVRALIDHLVLRIPTALGS